MKITIGCGESVTVHVDGSDEWIQVTVSLYGGVTTQRHSDGKTQLLVTPDQHRPLERDDLNSMEDGLPVEVSWPCCYHNGNRMPSGYWRTGTMTTNSYGHRRVVIDDTQESAPVEVGDAHVRKVAP